MLDYVDTAQRSAQTTLDSAQMALDNLADNVANEVRDAAQSALNNAQETFDRVKDNAGERGLIELTSGRKVTIDIIDPKVGNQFILGDAADGVQEAFNEVGISRGPSILFANDNNARKFLARASEKGFDFTKFGLIDGPINNSDFTFSLAGRGFRLDKIDEWNSALSNNPNVGLSPSARENLLSSTDIENIRADSGDALRNVGVDPNDVPWYKSAKFIKFVKIAGKFGLVFSILGLATIAAQAEELREQDKEAEANKLWTEYIFETAGGFVAGITVFLLANKFLPSPSPYVIAAKLFLTIAAGIGGAFGGAYLGGLVYDFNKKEIDAQFAELYARLDELIASDADSFAEILAGFFGFDLTSVEGTAEADFLFADKYEKRDGNEGDDTIIGFSAEFVAAGDPIIPEDPDSQIAQQDLRMVLDGGAGDDTIITLGGTGAITIGGEGRDFIFNTSEFGQIYGDTIDGLDADGNELVHEGLENSDVFWYWPGTFIQDAQPNDILQIFGIPLVGGSNSVAGIPAGDGSLAIDFFNWTTFYGTTTSGQLLVYNAIFDALDIGFEGREGVQVVEDYDFGGFSDENYGRAAAGDLGLTFRIFLPRDRADEGITISLFNAAWGTVFTYLDVASNLAKLLCFVFILPQTSRKYCY